MDSQTLEMRNGKAIYAQYEGKTIRGIIYGNLLLVPELEPSCDNRNFRSKENGYHINLRQIDAHEIHQGADIAELSDMEKLILESIEKKAQPDASVPIRITGLFLKAELKV